MKTLTKIIAIGLPLVMGICGCGDYQFKGKIGNEEVEHFKSKGGIYMNSISVTKTDGTKIDYETNPNGKVKQVVIRRANDNSVITWYTNTNPDNAPIINEA